MNAAGKYRTINGEDKSIESNVDGGSLMNDKYTRKNVSSPIIFKWKICHDDRRSIVCVAGRDATGG